LAAKLSHCRTQSAHTTELIGLATSERTGNFVEISGNLDSLMWVGTGPGRLVQQLLFIGSDSRLERRFASQPLFFGAICFQWFATDLTLHSWVCLGAVGFFNATIMQRILDTTKSFSPTPWTPLVPKQRQKCYLIDSLSLALRHRTWNESRSPRSYEKSCEFAPMIRLTPPTQRHPSFAPLKPNRIRARVAEGLLSVNKLDLPNSSLGGFRRGAQNHV
jgi:hypothetical protein